MFKEQHYASRYIVDVDITETYIAIGDANHVKYYIDKSNVELVTQFKWWLENVFSKGISGTLTVFEYEKIEHDGQIESIVKKFCNLRKVAIATFQSNQ